MVSLGWGGATWCTKIDGTVDPNTHEFHWWMLGPSKVKESVLCMRIQNKGYPPIPFIIS